VSRFIDDEAQETSASEGSKSEVNSEASEEDTSARGGSRRPPLNRQLL
jgi:hypothetical protein